MSTRRTRRERDALRDLGWKLTLDPYEPPELDLIDIEVPGDAGKMLILDARCDGTAYVKSNLSHDIADCR